MSKECKRKSEAKNVKIIQISLCSHYLYSIYFPICFLLIPPLTNSVDRGQSIKRSKTHFERIEADVLDEIETASVLDFSSKKRELVIGIDRKPEIKPLSVFKLSDTSGSAMSSLESVSLSPDTTNEVSQGFI